MGHSVTSIARGAFAQYTGLGADVTIGNGVTSIEDGAFSGTDLTSVTILKSVTSIGSQTFAAVTSPHGY